MDLTPFIKKLRSGARKIGEAHVTEALEHAKLLHAQDDFQRIVRSPTLLATAKACQLVLNRPYVSSEAAAFRDKHSLALSQFAVELAHWERSASTLELPRRDRVLVASWHFPQVPTLLAFAKKVNALLIVSQDAEWLEPLRAAGCTLNFSSAGAAVTLARAMAGGRIVATMLDNIHRGSKSEEACLLGRVVNTPSGVLELAIRCEYLLAFIAPRGDMVQIIDTAETHGRTSKKLAQIYNHWLETEIKQNPANWLMWASFSPQALS